MNESFLEINEVIHTATPGTIIYEGIGVGKGKTTNIFGDTIPWIVSKKEVLLFLTPRISLYDKCKEMLKQYAFDNGYPLEYIRQFVKIMTVQSVIKRFENGYRLPEISWLIFDECQSLTQESDFIPEMNELLSYILENDKRIVTILLSGTGDAFITEFKKHLKWKYENKGILPLMPKLFEFEEKSKFDYLKPCFFGSQNEVVDIIRSRKEDCKTLVFVDTCEFGEILVKSLKDEGISATFLSSKTIDREMDTVKQINMLNTFSVSCLICTSVLSVGVDICSEVGQIILLPNVSLPEVAVQCVARRRVKRQESIDLYICDRNREYFEKVIETQIKKISCYEKCKDAIDKGEENLIYLVMNNSDNKDIYKYCFYISKDGIKFNELGYRESLRKMYLLKKYYQGLSVDEDYYRKNVLLWFGLEIKQENVPRFATTYREDVLKEFTERVEAQMATDDVLCKDDGKVFLNELKSLVVRLDNRYHKTQLMPNDFNDFCEKNALPYFCDNKDSRLNKEGTVYHFIRRNFNNIEEGGADDGRC